MTGRITDALAALRAADPATEQTVAALLRQYPADQTLSSVLDQVGRPSEPFEPTDEPSRLRARWIRPALAVAAVLVVAAGTAGIVAATTGSTQRPSAASTSTSGRSAGVTQNGAAVGPVPPAVTEPQWDQPNTTGTSTDPHFAATDRYLRALLAAAPLPPGSVPSAFAPEPPLEQTSYQEDGNLVSRGAWFTAPGTVSAAIAYLRAHPPAGAPRLEVTGTGTTKGVPNDWLTFAGAGSASTSSPQVQYTVTPHGPGIALRVDAQGIWLPTRQPAELVPPVTEVALMVTRPPSSFRKGAPTVSRTVTGAAAQQLADAVNALPVSTPSVHSCPAGSMPPATDVLTYRTGAHVYVVTVYLEGCGYTTFTIDGRTLPSLDGGGTLDQPVLTALGLPPNYGGV